MVAPVAISIANASAWVYISTGYAQTCVVESAADAYCFGLGTSGQLGNASSASSASRVRVNYVDIAWKQLAGGLQATCGVSINGSAYCFGSQLTDKSYYVVNSQSPSQVAGADWALASEGYNGQHFCFLKLDGTAWCSGVNNYGQLGIGSILDPTNYPNLNSPSPSIVSGWSNGVLFQAITTGMYHTCALQTNLSLWCW